VTQSVFNFGALKVVCKLTALYLYQLVKALFQVALLFAGICPVENVTGNLPKALVTAEPYGVTGLCPLLLFSKNNVSFEDTFLAREIV
jgi:hypothetical protein